MGPRDDDVAVHDTAFHAAIAEPLRDPFGLRDAAAAHAILASSDEDLHHADPASRR